MLEQEKASSLFLDMSLEENALVITGVLGLVGVGFAGVYYFNLRKEGGRDKKMPPPPVLPKIEDDEEKVAGLLQAAGGVLYQSTLADECRFSRAKASKLLATMEKKGIVMRKEKGREKIVTLTDQAN